MLALFRHINDHLLICRLVSEHGVLHLAMLLCCLKSTAEAISLCTKKVHNLFVCECLRVFDAECLLPIICCYVVLSV